MKFVFYKSNVLGCSGVTLGVSVRVGNAEVEKLYEVYNEVTPDTLLGLRCKGL